MDINKNSSDSIRLNITNVTENNNKTSTKVNRYTEKKSINASKNIAYLRTEDTVVCTTSKQQQQQIIKFNEKKHDPQSVIVLYTLPMKTRTFIGKVYI